MRCVICLAIFILISCGSNVNTSSLSNLKDLVEKAYMTKDDELLYNLFDFKDTEDEIKVGFKSMLNLKNGTSVVSSIDVGEFNDFPDLTAGRMFKKNLKWHKIPSHVIVVNLTSKENVGSTAVLKFPVYQIKDK